MTYLRSFPALILAVACGADPGEGETIEILASSRYVDFTTPADSSEVCMDDALGEWDRFIDATASALGVEPPAERIRYTWVPPSLITEGAAWGCDTIWYGCYKADKATGRGIIYAKVPELLHEFVHAVERPALGASHPVLREGIAEFLSSSVISYGSDTFPEEMTALLSADHPPSSVGDYQLAKHFVAGLIERKGMATYRSLRAALAADADAETFAAVYAEVVGEPLELALADLVTRAIPAAWTPRGCRVDDTVETLEWTTQGHLEATLVGRCGDLGFGTGFYTGGAEEQVYFKTYGLNVELGGSYSLTIDGAGADHRVQVAACPLGSIAPDGYVDATGAESGFGALAPGRARVVVTYPISEAEHEVSITLDYDHP